MIFLLHHIAKMSTTKDLNFYFKHHSDGQSASLPASISQATIDAVNREVGAIPVGNGSKTRGEYIKVIDEERAIVGEHAAKHGTVRFFKQDQKFSNLKEATVCGWKNLYLRELCIQSQDRKCDAPSVQIEVLPSGRPLLIGQKWEDKVKSFVKLQRDKGSVVNTETVMATVVGVVISHDANLLAENGGHIDNI